MMMMIGRSPHSHPTVQVPPWDFTDDPTVDVHSPFSTTDYGFDALTTSLQRYLPSNANDIVFDSDDLDIPVDAFSCDNFRMYEFKVKKCARGRSHDWTECPYAHPGEKARRRDPRKYHYSGTACPEFRRGQCCKGDACEYAHGVFECWLHPARYRTQPCKDGTHCRRRVCFFAHTPDQLRLVPPQSPSPRSRGGGGGGPECFDSSQLGFDSVDVSSGQLLFDSFDGSPSRLGFDSFSSKGRQIIYSPPSSSPPYQSPPMSPSAPLSYNSVNGLAESMRGLQIGNKVRMGMSPPSWGGLQMGSGSGSGSGFSSPRSPSTLRPGFMDHPTTPTRKLTRSGFSVFENSFEEEPVMERVESGRGLRARMYAKLSMENSLDSSGSFPDVGWVSELVK